VECNLLPPDFYLCIGLLLYMQAGIRFVWETSRLGQWQEGRFDGSFGLYGQP